MTSLSPEHFLDLGPHWTACANPLGNDLRFLDGGNPAWELKNWTTWQVPLRSDFFLGKANLARNCSNNFWTIVQQWFKLQQLVTRVFVFFFFYKELLQLFRGAWGARFLASLWIVCGHFAPRLEETAFTAVRHRGGSILEMATTARELTHFLPWLDLLVWFRPIAFFWQLLSSHEDLALFVDMQNPALEATKGSHKSKMIQDAVWCTDANWSKAFHKVSYDHSMACVCNAEMRPETTWNDVVRKCEEYTTDGDVLRQCSCEFLCSDERLCDALGLCWSPHFLWCWWASALLCPEAHFFPYFFRFSFFFQSQLLYNATVEKLCCIAAWSRHVHAVLQSSTKNKWMARYTSARVKLAIHILIHLKFIVDSEWHPDLWNESEWLGMTVYTFLE